MVHDPDRRERGRPWHCTRLEAWFAPTTSQVARASAVSKASQEDLSWEDLKQTLYAKHSSHQLLPFASVLCPRTLGLPHDGSSMGYRGPRVPLSGLTKDDKAWGILGTPQGTVSLTSDMKVSKNQVDLILTPTSKALQKGHPQKGTPIYRNSHMHASVLSNSSFGRTLTGTSLFQTRLRGARCWLATLSAAPASKRLRQLSTSYC